MLSFEAQLNVSLRNTYYDSNITPCKPYYKPYIIPIVSFSFSMIPNVIANLPPDAPEESDLCSWLQGFRRSEVPFDSPETMV